MWKNDKEKRYPEGYGGAYCSDTCTGPNNNFKILKEKF